LDTEDGGVGFRPKGSRVDASGGALDPGGLALWDAGISSYGLVAVWTGTAYLVLWNDGAGNLLARKFSAGGLPSGAAPWAVPGATGALGVAAATDGNAVFVAWKSLISTMSVHGRRFDLDGGPLDLSPLNLSAGAVAPSDVSGLTTPSVAALKSGWAV